MPYKNFSSFKDFSTFLFLGTCPYQTAHRIEPPPADVRFDDVYFLIKRNSEHEAQIEVLCSKLFALFTGQGPEVEIIRNDDGVFYIASRRIKGFRTGFPDFRDESRFDSITGYAAQNILNYFLCGNDNHRHLTPDELLAADVKPGLSLSAYRERFTLSKEITTSSGQKFPDQKINIGILDYGLKQRQRAHRFFDQCPCSGADIAITG